MSDQYKDINFGYFDDVINNVSFEYDAFVQTGFSINSQGIREATFTKQTILGSLQAYRKKNNYAEDGKPNVSQRDGKFFANYDIVLNEGDLIRRRDNGNTFKVIDIDDFDYAGVRVYYVARLNLSEISVYDFLSEKEVTFDDNTE